MDNNKEGIMGPLRGNFPESPIGRSQDTKPIHPTQKKVTEISKKAKEAEDLSKTPRKLTRQVSLRDVKSGEKSEAAEIEKKEGGLWHCLSRTPNKEGGYIYHFQLKPEFDDITPHPDIEERRETNAAKTKEMFPAIETIGSRYALLDPKADQDTKIEACIDDAIKVGPPFIARMHREHIKSRLSEEIESQIQEHLILQDLGYKAERTEDGVYLSLPDQEALLAKWELLRETRPTLPPFDIISSEGIATDIDFLEAFFTHDALLSTGKEFVHDHLSHVSSQILLLLSGTPLDYKEERVRQIKKFARSYRNLIVVKRHIEEGKVHRPKEELERIKKRLNQFEAVLGAAVDVTSNYSSYTYLRQLNVTFGMVTLDPKFRDVWVKRYGDEGLHPDLPWTFKEGEIKEILTEIDALLHPQDKKKII